MSNIKWEEGAVFYANGTQFREGCGGFQRYNDILESWQRTISGDELDKALKSKDFQLNEMRIGDYIEASELDTEQKYNDAVEVFELFGFEPYLNCDMDKSEFIKQALNYGEGLIADDELDLVIDYNDVNDISQKIRKITYPQLMAIGKLKRLEVERGRGGMLPNHFLPKAGEYAVSDKELEKSAPKIAPDLTPDLGVVSSNKYEREITDRQGDSAVVDVYDVLKAFEVTCPATQHALKKLLCSGLRGHKDLQTDLLEAKESITRSIELNG